MINFNELKLKIKSWRANFNFSDWSSNFLLKKNRIFLLAFSLVVFSYCSYLWYSYLFRPEWSEVKKQQYIESKKEEEVVFSKGNFDKVISEIEIRKSYFQKSTGDIPDIFSLK